MLNNKISNKPRSGKRLPTQLIQFLILLILGGCSGAGTDFNFVKIETPSAIGHFSLLDQGNNDIYANYQTGFITMGKHVTEIASDVTELDDEVVVEVITSYIVDGQNRARDLSGAVLSIDLNNQKGSGTFGDNFHEIVHHIMVLEYRFPETTDNGTEINWFITPHFICSYYMEQNNEYLTPANESNPPVSLYVDYLFYEDQLGNFDLRKTNRDDLINLFSANLQPISEFHFEGNNNSSIGDFHRDMSGRIVINGQGVEARIFLGVSIWIEVSEMGDRVQLGRGELPKDMSITDRCSLDFGTDSYFTMKPANQD